MSTPVRFAVVGATGVVGREILSALIEHDISDEDVTLLGSDRSEAEELEYGAETLPVEKVEADSFRGMNAVLLATPPEVSRKLAPKAQAAGAWVVDVSPAYRKDPEIPLVLPGFNDAVLRSGFKGRIVATPSPIASALVTLLEPLRQGFGVERVFVTALLGASSAGKSGVDELEKQVGSLMSGREGEPEVFPHRLGFNLIPQVGAFGGADPSTGEERAWADELSRLWSKDAPKVSGTAVQVPTFYGHALSLHLKLGGSPALEAVRGALEKGRGVKVLDAPGEKVYPMPMLITADPSVHVGRLRPSGEGDGWFELFAVIDNAGRSAHEAVNVALALLGPKA